MVSITRRHLDFRQLGLVRLGAYLAGNSTMARRNDKRLGWCSFSICSARALAPHWRLPFGAWQCLLGRCVALFSLIAFNAYAVIYGCSTNVIFPSADPRYRSVMGFEVLLYDHGVPSVSLPLPPLELRSHFQIQPVVKALLACV